MNPVLLDCWISLLAPLTRWKVTSGVNGGTSPSPNALGALQWKCSSEQWTAPSPCCDTDQFGPGHLELSVQESQAGTQQVLASEMRWGFTEVRDHPGWALCLPCLVHALLPSCLFWHSKLDLGWNSRTGLFPSMDRVFRTCYIFSTGISFDTILSCPGLITADSSCRWGFLGS